MTCGSSASANPSHHKTAAEKGRVSVTALVIFGLALIAGSYFRFVVLGRYELSADEGASWAAASAGSLAEVLRLQPLLNPGKLAVHDLALHAWMRMLGDSLVAVRSLSALAGTLAVAAVFFLTRELFLASGGDETVPRGEPRDDSLAAVAALIFAVNLVTIKYSQEARMYALALLFGLLQAWFYLRLQRTSFVLDFILAALFTALCIASTFTMTLLLVPEALWMLYLLSRSNGRILHRFIVLASALAAGLLLLVIPMWLYLQARSGAPALTAYAWSPPPPFYAPIALFNKGTGSFAFPLLAALAVWGIFRTWGLARNAIIFLLLWMFAPPLVVFAASYLIRPAFVERYMLASFIPFFVLSAIGICSVSSPVLRYLSLLIVAGLAIGHVWSYDRKPHGAEWREATLAASSLAGHLNPIAVAPPYAVNVVRYYLRDSNDANLVLPTRNAPKARVAIVADTGVSEAEAEQLARDYPHLMRRLRGVIVRTR